MNAGVPVVGEQHGIDGLLAAGILMVDGRELTVGICSPPASSRVAGSSSRAICPTVSHWSPRSPPAIRR